MDNLIKTKNENFKLRFAKREDTKLILQFIKELAEYENLQHEVVATEEVLSDSLFNRGIAEVIIGEFNGEAIGFALFFYNISTFNGKPGIYLEDLYIKQNMRGKGLGRIILCYLAKLAIERNCGRLEWSCLDWNEPSIKFYKNLGAKPMDEWTIYRLSDKALINLANE